VLGRFRTVFDILWGKQTRYCTSFYVTALLFHQCTF